MRKCENGLVSNLFSLIKAKGESVQSVSRLSGVPASTIYNWAHKGNDPSLENFQRVLKTINAEVVIK